MIVTPTSPTNVKGSTTLLRIVAPDSVAHAVS